MKKIIIIAVSALTALLASCNMDKFPHGVILESEGVKTMADAEGFRSGIYMYAKSMFGGGRYTLDEICGGQFNAMADYGNADGAFYRWEMQATESSAQSLWYGDYGIIASMNYTIEAYDKLLDDEQAGLSESDVAKLENYKAEAHMTRAMAYWDMVTKYCVAYEDEDQAKEVFGLPLQTVYAPTSDVSKYPGRSSLYDTYKLIESDLLEALNITDEGQPNTNYFSKDSAKALLARLYLNMRDWAKASKNAQDVILSQRYPLATDAAALESLYVSDLSNELIFVAYGEVNDPHNSTGGGTYINDTVDGSGENPKPTYTPSQTLLNLYGTTPEAREKDRRYDIFFETREITIPNQSPANLELFWKFAGNPEYQKTQGVLNCINAGKIRVAEMYLTLAEAGAKLGTAEGLKAANDALNDLRESRIDGYTRVEYPDEETIMGVIEAEWSREFVGEGFQMINLKRWEKDRVVGTPQASNLVYRGDNLESLNKSIKDSRAIWPIPKAEMDVNPQLKGQQNFGY